MEKEILEYIEKLVAEVGKNPDILKDLKEKPAEMIEKMTGVKLPEELLQKVVAGVEAQISVDKLGDLASGLKKLF